MTETIPLTEGTLSLVDPETSELVLEIQVSGKTLQVYDYTGFCVINCRNMDWLRMIPGRRKVVMQANNPKDTLEIQEETPLPTSEKRS